MSSSVQKELFYFVKAIALVVVLAGLMSTVVVLILSQGTVETDANAMIDVLGKHRIWINIVAILWTTYFLHGSRTISDKKKFGVELAKVIVYYAGVTFVINLGF